MTTTADTYPPAVLAEIERGRKRIAEYAAAEADLFARRREAFRRLVVGLLDEMPPDVGAWLYERMGALEVSTAHSRCLVTFAGFPRTLTLTAEFVAGDPRFNSDKAWRVSDFRYLDRWFGPHEWCAAFAAAAERVE